MSDLRRDLLDLLCWDEKSFTEARYVDTDHIDLIGEIDSATREALEDGSWNDERRRRILERAKARALDGRSREEAALANAVRFLEALPDEDRACLGGEVAPDTLPDRIERSLAGVATAIVSTLPRALRRRGSASFEVRTVEGSPRGRWKDAGGASSALDLDGVIRLQFERMGELTPTLAIRLSRELFRALAEDLVQVPGFRTRPKGPRSFLLVWSADRGEGAAESALEIAHEPAFRATGLKAVPEYAEVATVLFTNYSSARRDPDEVHVEAFVPRVDPETVVPTLVTELAERAHTSSQVVSGELGALVRVQIDTLCAKASREGLSRSMQKVLDKALARLKDNHDLLARLQTT